MRENKEGSEISNQQVCVIFCRTEENNERDLRTAGRAPSTVRKRRATPLNSFSHSHRDVRGIEGGKMDPGRRGEAVEANVEVGSRVFGPTGKEGESQG